MKGKRRTLEEKVRSLRQADGGKTILKVCDDINISDQTFHRWKKELGLLNVKHAKRLKELETENKRLRRIVADQVLGMVFLQEAIEKELCVRDTKDRWPRALEPKAAVPDAKPVVTFGYIDLPF